MRFSCGSVAALFNAELLLALRKPLKTLKTAMGASC